MSRIGVENIKGIEVQEGSLIRRNEIDKAIESGNHRRLREMGIEIIPEEQASNESCFETTFPSDTYPPKTLLLVMSDGQVTGKPEVEDIAVYTNRKGSVVHLGRYRGDGRVISRWGLGGLLCIHPPLDIPTYPGKEIKVSYYPQTK